MALNYHVPYSVKKKKKKKKKNRDTRPPKQPNVSSADGRASSYDSNSKILDNVRLEINSLKIKICTLGQNEDAESLFGSHQPPHLIIHCSGLHCLSTNRRWEEVPLSDTFSRTAEEALINKAIKFRSVNCWFVPTDGARHVHFLKDISPVYEQHI